MITDKSCKRLGCGKPDAVRVEWRTPGGFLVATYLCDGCRERWERERNASTFGPIEIEQPPADVVSLAERRGHRDVKPGNKPDKEPA